jgi:uncharacterized protein (TIGR03085 family)
MSAGRHSIPGMTRYAQAERAGLADELLAVGADAPTLCTGWQARDLAAHLVTRERRADAAPGAVVAALAGWTDRVRNGYRDAHPYPELVEMFRHPPVWTPMRIAALDEMANVVEYFVHREDVRRARPGWQPRRIDEGLSRYLWQRVPTMARLWHRRRPGSLTVHAPGFGTYRHGTAEPALTLTGEPGELILFLFGRRPVARVELTGPEDIIAKLRGRRTDQ